MDVAIVIEAALKGNSIIFLSTKEMICGIKGRTHAVLCQIHILRSLERIRDETTVTGDT